MSLTIVMYASLFYFGFVQRGGVYDDLRVKLTQTMLNSLVPAIEFYRVQHGQYPESLEVLRESLGPDTFVSIYDTQSVELGSTPQTFYYERIGADHYLLRGRGMDREPFTTDDIVPQLPSSSTGAIGLLLQRPEA